DRAAPTCAVFRRRPYPRVAKRLLGSDEHEAVRAVRVLQELAVLDELVAEALDFRGDADRKTARVESGDRRAAAATCEQRVPRGGYVVADRRDEPDSGDRDAPAILLRCAGAHARLRTVVITNGFMRADWPRRRGAQWRPSCRRVARRA